MKEEDKPLEELLDKIDEQWDKVEWFEDTYGRHLDSWPKRKLVNLAKKADEMGKTTKAGKAVKAGKDWLTRYAKMRFINPQSKASFDALKKWAVDKAMELEEEE